MQRLLKIAGKWLLLLIGAVAVVYVCEDLLLRYRQNHGGRNRVFDNVTMYPAAAVKGGKEEFYFDQPQVVECVRALFPHFGDAPCWYARRHTIELLSLIPEAWPRTDTHRVQDARSSKVDVIWIWGWSERYTGHLGAKMPWTRAIVSRLSSGAAITNAT